MLHYARENAGERLSEGRARFVRADGAEFRVEGQFGLATSTFSAVGDKGFVTTPALAHLPRLRRLHPGGSH